jgi:NADH-quinone oxidoreductase subunit N
MEYLALVPELLLLIGGLIGLTGLIGRRSLRGVIPALSFLFAVAAFGIELWQGARLATFADGSYTQDRFALFGKAAVTLTLALWVAATRADREFDDRLLPLGFLIALGGALISSTTVTFLLWVGLLLALGGFLIPFFARRRYHGDGRELAALAGLVAAGLGLLWLSLTFHSWRLSQLMVSIPRLPVSLGAGLLAMLALTGVAAPLIGIAYSARGEEATLGDSGRGRTQHRLEPGLQSLLCGVLLVVLVLAAARIGAAAFRVGPLWGPLLAVLAVVAALAGGLGALAARSVRGLVAWLAFAGAGLALAALAVHSQMGTAAALFLVVAVGVAGATAPLLAAGLDGPRAGVAGLGGRQPGRSIGLSVTLLSLAGVPPAAGFAGLFWAGLTLVQSRLIWVLCALLLAAALGSWAVVRVLLLVWIEPEPEEHRPAGTVVALGGLLAAAVILLYVVFANPISDLAVQAAEAVGLHH